MRLLTQSTSQGFDPSLQSWWILRYSLQNLRGLLARWMVLLARFATSSKCKCNWSCRDLYHSGGSKASVACAVLSPCLFVWQIWSVWYQWGIRGRSSRWLHLDIGAAKLVPIATSEFGFEYHHVTRFVRESSELLAAASTCSDSSI